MTVRQEPCGRFYVYGPMDVEQIKRDTAAHFREAFGREPLAEMHVMTAQTLLAVCDTEEEARQWLR